MSLSFTCMHVHVYIYKEQRKQAALKVNIYHIEI